MHFTITRGLSYDLVIQTRSGSELWLGFAATSNHLPHITPGYTEDNVATYRAFYLGRFFIVLQISKRRLQPAHAS